MVAAVRPGARACPLAIFDNQQESGERLLVGGRPAYDDSAVRTRCSTTGFLRSDSFQDSARGSTTLSNGKEHVKNTF